MKEKAVSLLIGVLLALVGIGTVQAVSSALSEPDEIELGPAIRVETPSA